MATESEIVALLDGLTLIASRAAAAILAVPRLDLNRRDKPDASPVTAADDASETVILAGLARLMPGVPVVSEESTGNRPVEGLGQRFFIVDPLDGTREFLADLDEYIVNIALVENETPVAGRGRGAGARPDLARHMPATAPSGLRWRQAPRRCRARARCHPHPRRVPQAARASWSAARISIRRPTPMSIACRRRKKSPAARR